MNYTRFILLRMLGFLVVIGVMAVGLRTSLTLAFRHNIYLNSLILILLSGGILYSFFRLIQIKNEFKWFEAFCVKEHQFPGVPKPVILQPVAFLAQDPKNDSLLTPQYLQSILTSVDARIEEKREGTKYLTSLLVFMGLLGTFWGLSQTIGAVANIITDLDVGASQVKEAFQNLKTGLHAPLTGMGTAFSSSMFGLMSSLIIGFLDLQVMKAAGRLFQTVEKELTHHVKEITPFPMDVSAIPLSGSAYVKGLLEQAAENMTQLQSAMRTNEENRATIVQAIQIFSDRVAHLTDQMIAQQHLLVKIAHSQLDFQRLLDQLELNNEPLPKKIADESIQHYIRSIDASGKHLLAEVVEGRKQMVQELKNEIRLVARTISALAEQDAA